MSSKPSKKQRKKQAAALAAASASLGSSISEDVIERGSRRNQAIGHGAITIQPDLLDMHSKRKKSAAALSRSSKGSSLKGSKNAAVTTVVSKKGIEMVSTSVLLQIQLSNGTLKRIRFEAKDTIAQCLKQLAKHDKDISGTLFSLAGGIWLADDRSIGSYNFEEMVPYPPPPPCTHITV